MENKNLKFILTTKCNRNCGYCINHSAKIADFDGRPTDEYITSLRILFKLLKHRGNQRIMLTGGEPTHHPLFPEILRTASAFFPFTDITTADPFKLFSFIYPPKNLAPLLASIVITYHLDQTEIFPVNDIYRPVYASFMAFDERLRDLDSLILTLERRGYNGITINDDHLGLKQYDDYEIPDLQKKYEFFTFKINRAGYCLDSTIITPNLELVNSFSNLITLKINQHQDD